MNAFRLSLALLLVAWSSTQCWAAHSRAPTIDVLGSYFPAWIACIFIGLTFSLLARQLFIGVKLDRHLRFVGLVYLCLTILFTLAAWLIWFKG